MKPTGKSGKEMPFSKSIPKTKPSGSTSSTRVTRSTTKRVSTTGSTTENSKNTGLIRKGGYSQPTKSTLGKKAQQETAQKSEPLNTEVGVDSSGANGDPARKRKCSGTQPAKRTKVPLSKLPLTHSVTTSSSSAPKTPEKAEPKKILTPKDLGVGYLQYLGPCEVALYNAYSHASPMDRLAMIKQGEIDDEEVEKAFALEHIFDHLPVPGEQFEPVKAAEGPEMYLEPGLRELFLLEKKKRFSVHYLDHQPFTFETRTEIVDMMAKKLLASTWRRDTFLLAVNILDTVLSRGELRRAELVIYSLACLQIAIKLNERFLMSYEDLISSSAEEISKAKVERAEMNILNFLDFDVYCIPSHQFLIRINQLDKFNKPLLTMAKYLLEVSLFDLNLVTELSSKVAAASYALARRILVDSSWTPSRHYYSGYSLEELEPLIDLIIDTVQRIPTDGNMFSHYNSEKLYYASDRVHAVLCRDYTQASF